MEPKEIIKLARVLKQLGCRKFSDPKSGIVIEFDSHIQPKTETIVESPAAAVAVELTPNINFSDPGYAS